MDTSQDRAVIRLLGATVALLCLLVVGLGVGGLFALHEYRELRRAVPDAATLAQFKVTAESAQAALDQLTDRQDVLASALDKNADITRAKLKLLEDRRRQLEPLAGGPIDKMNQTIRLAQLLSDEGLLAVEHLLRLQEVMGRSARPLKAQRQAREASEPSRP